MLHIREELTGLSEQLKKQLDPTKSAHQEIVRNGMLLFRERAVTITAHTLEQVVAKVNDHPNVHVDLHFNRLHTSLCTCEEDHVCKHLLALFFHQLSKDSNPLDWVQEWKRDYKMTDILSTLKRGSDLLTETSVHMDDGPSKWIQKIKSVFQQKAPQHPFQLEEWAKANYRRLLKSAPINQEWQPLFQLFVAYESLKAMIDMWTKQLGDKSKFTSRLDAFCEYMLFELESTLSHLNTVATPFAFDPYYRYLREDSATLLENETFYPKGLLDAYFLLWSSLFTQKALRQKELERLQKRNDEQGSKRLTIATIHLAILLGKNDFALKQIECFEPNISIYALQWLKLLQAEDPPTRLASYLMVFLKQINLYISSQESQEKTQFTQAFFHILDEQLVKSLDTSLIERVYRMLLPMSRYQYATFLLDKKKYRTWAELQATTLLFNLEYMETSTIELVEKHEPRTLFPLYHHTISDLINSRNRPSYQRAVKYLKKLRLLYKKEQNFQQWNRYLNNLLKKTRRLRAFQEECRKGKLVTDESR